MKHFRFHSAVAGPVSDHCDGRSFFNPDPIEHRLSDLWRWRRTRVSKPWQRVTDFVPALPPPARVADLRVTWINHATVLIQCAGMNILTDPIWSEWAGPLPGLGARRFHPPGIRFPDLPPIDVVLISHSHYDHLDRATIRRLIGAYAPAFIVPLGLTGWLLRHGAKNVTELDWWQSHPLSASLTLHATPARHWTRRGLCDYNRSLWCGYYLQLGAGNACNSIYFAGDTGMADHFEAIRRRLGAPRIALLPIGAYEPRWFMQKQHMDPAEAVAAHQKLQAQTSIGIHFATFKLADEGQHEAGIDLARARDAANLPAGQFVVPAFGESVTWQATGPD